MTRAKTMRACAAFAAVLALGGWTAARAGVINIGTGAGTANALGAAAQAPNLVGNGSDVSIALSGTGSALATITLALVYPSGAGFNSLGAATLYGDYSGQTSGGAALAADGGAQAMGALTGGSLANLLAGFDASNTFNQFTGFDAGLGLHTSSFSAVSWKIHTGALLGLTNPLINVTFPGGEAQGSVFAALSDTGSASLWLNAGGVNVGGIVPSPTPEPASWSLVGLGTVLLGLSFGLRDWRRRRAAQKFNSLPELNA